MLHFSQKICTYIDTHFGPGVVGRQTTHFLSLLPLYSRLSAIYSAYNEMYIYMNISCCNIFVCNDDQISTDELYVRSFFVVHCDCELPDASLSHA